eukprot:scaffold3959_cov128-Isochrysis_galbana.AAC.2
MKTVEQVPATTASTAVRLGATKLASGKGGPGGAFAAMRPRLLSSSGLPNSLLRQRGTHAQGQGRCGSRGNRS